MLYLSPVLYFFVLYEYCIVPVLYKPVRIVCILSKKCCIFVLHFSVVFLCFIFMLYFSVVF